MKRRMLELAAALFIALFAHTTFGQDNPNEQQLNGLPAPIPYGPGAVRKFIDTTYPYGTNQPTHVGCNPSVQSCITTNTNSPAYTASCVNGIRTEQCNLMVVVTADPVGTGTNFQTTIDASRPGDVILIPANAYLRTPQYGTFKLPYKDNPSGKWIIIRSASPSFDVNSTATPAIPPNSRVNGLDPLHTNQMPKLRTQSINVPVIMFAAGSNHYRLVGLDLGLEPSVRTFDSAGLIMPADQSFREGSEDSTDQIAKMVSDIIIDRCYVHGNDPEPETVPFQQRSYRDCKRGIALNGIRMSIIESYISNFHYRGNEAQGIGGWKGGGPFKIVNNFVEASGENIMFGGADMKVEYLVPSDIEIRRNHLYKNPAWRGVRDNNPSGYQYTIYTTKNLLELKMARRVLIDGNILENNWADAQSGYGVLFTVKNQEGDFADTPENESDFWSTVEDITFTNNILRNSASGILISGRDYSNQSDKTRRILVENNLFDNIGAFDGQGTFLLMDGTDNVSRGAPDTGAEHFTINHNTIFHTGTLVYAANQFTVNPDTYINHPGFVFTNNISRKNQYGINGSAASEGTNTINSYFRAEGSFPAGKFKRNVIASPTGTLSYYPTDNCYGLLESAFNNEFENYEGGYRLKAGSYSKSCRGTDGKDVGYNVDLLNVAINRDNRGRRNAIDTQQFFVYMQYKDFFNRTPSRGEVNLWAHVMQQPDCPVADMCYDRIYIAGKAFFQSEEFQQKGYFTYRFYPVAFGRVNGKFVRPTYANFLDDTQFMNTTDPAKKLAFATAFIQRPEFSQIYGSLSNMDYVTTLLARIEIPNHPQRDGWIAALNNSTKSRPQVLMELVESPQVANGEQYNRAWVSMQYHAYLRRDADEGGYDDWLGVLNANPENWRLMTQGFIDSTEYRARFGTP